MNSELLDRLEAGRQFTPEEQAERERREEAAREHLKNLTPVGKTTAPVKYPQLTGAKSFNLTPLLALYKEPVEALDYILDGMLIKGGLSIVVGKPKAGKTTWALNLVYAVANEITSFIGRTITASGPVVYLALEEKRSEVRKRFERMGAAEDLPIFVHTGSAPEKAIDELRTAVIESKAVLAVVDPLQRLIRIRDLNDYSSVSLAFEPLMQIARDTGCHIMLVHHANKGMGKEGGDSILGSTAIFGSVDCALIIKRGEEYRTIESIQRYGEDMPRTVLNFDVATGLTSSGGSLEDAQITDCGKAIIQFIDGNEVTEKEIKEAITDYNSGVKSKSLRALCQDGIVLRQGEGKRGGPYTYSLTVKKGGYSGFSYIHKPTIPTISKTDNSANLATKTAEKVGTEIFEVLPNNENSHTHHFDNPPEEPPLTPEDDIPPDEELEPWEIAAGITAGPDGERILGARP